VAHRNTERILRDFANSDNIVWLVPSRFKVKKQDNVYNEP